MKRLVAILALGVAAGGCDSERAFADRTEEDNWFQAPNNEVDILWVVDDSCSMAEEQATLANGIQSFVTQMESSGTDFHIGVISTSFEYTDDTRGSLIGDPPYLTNRDDYVQGFIDRATGLGVDGSDREKGLEAAAHALSPQMTFGGANAGFLRATAQLLIVFVSDEEDCSDRGALGDQDAKQCYVQSEKLVPIGDFVTEFRDLKSNRDMVNVGAIVGVQNAACDDAHPGSRYIKTAKHTGGLVSDICLADWSNTLADLGLTATGIRTAFQTTYPAKTETLTVKVNGEEMPQDEVNGWTYDPESCYLTFAPAVIPERDSDILAEYTAGPGTCGGTL